MEKYKKIVSSTYKEAAYGEKIYLNLIKKYGNKNILIFPHKSLGDIYILALFKNSGAAIFNSDYVFIVVGEKTKDCAENFGINNVISISPKDMASLIRFRIISHDENLMIKILHFEFYHTSCFFNIANYYHYNFISSYEDFVFHVKLNPKKQISYSTISNSLLESLNLEKGKTVIISPYAKSIPSFPYEWWSYIIMVLNNYGYKNIYTNCSESETTLPGTKRLNVPIKEMCGVLDYAGIFIGIRSGLCDIISRSKCKKIIFYPKQDSGIKSLLEFYSLKQIPFANNYKEYELTEPTFHFDEILDFLGSNEEDI